ncbi:hypothetical protein RHODGE_RHODGE_03318 [Rhodoplanes serenus]|uniref:Uncharacterized protein n=1 Tax=Rhodoplanes serenus TaxID=200615 RepID=A0A3S4BHJ0_9BRAD|nr:hypothetical protein [Rhodoplanes serenus]VCU10132.1 hypothetical protein RHODGE_RHODGE_03318 [Rhodoplanes serenus]
MDTDQEIFDAALQADPAPVTDVTDQGHGQPQAPDQPEPGLTRDERGRFAGKAEPAPEPSAPEPQPRDQDHRVPLRELLDERERRQTLAAEIAEERRQRETLQRQIAEMQRASQPRPHTPDIFEDPHGFIGQVEQRFEERLRAQEANFSLRLAHRQYGEEFEAAYESLIKAGHAGDRIAVQRVMAAADPGEAVVKWHRERQMVEKTGGDLDGYLKKREEELLSDPEFLKRVGEKLRAQQASTPGRPAPVVNLPPSLSRTPSAAPAASDGGDDMSDAGLFRHAVRR